MLSSLRKHPAYRVVLWALIILCMILLWRLNKSVLNESSRISGQDYSQFWAAGRLNRSGENPYDPVKINAIKSHLSGLEEAPRVVAIAYNPPWTLPIFMLFSLVEYTLSRLLWLMLSIVIMIYCANRTWRAYGGSERLRWVPLLVAFTLGPTYLLLRQGQLTPLVLLGIVGFLYQIEFKSNDWLAGAFAALVSIKPQLFFLFWIALVFWVVHRKRWRVLLGLGLTLGISTLIAAAFDKSLLSQYLPTVLNYSPTVWFTPTIGSYLRMLFGLENLWLQFIPPVAGILWFGVRWKNHHAHWRWSAEMPSLLFISLLTMSYGWTYDYVLLYAAIIPMASVMIRARSRRRIALVASAYFTVNLVYLGSQVHLEDGYLGWFLPALGVVYLLATRTIRTGEPGRLVGQV
ncbi:MAG: glycosyltransferase family 87 protein [Candidatus Eisenbacteria bacterium]